MVYLKSVGSLGPLIVGKKEKRQVTESEIIIIVFETHAFPTIAKYVLSCGKELVDPDIIVQCT